MEYANIILEMLDRIKTLEKEVESLKKTQSTLSQRTVREVPSSLILASNKRDTTRYMFDGNVYLKNRLVLAVVTTYVKENSAITCDELKNAFSKSLQGSLGVVEKAEVASLRADYTSRFFTKSEEVLHLIDGDMYVCSQWGILNIPNFIKIAHQYGYKIEAI